MDRDARHRLLLGLVMSESFRTQDELVSALRGRGVEVTQSSVSRDIRDLGLSKHEGIYTAPAEALAGPSGPDVWAFATAVQAAGDNLVVIRCRPGTAQTLAIELDQSSWAGVVGTIAGDDTIFLAVSEASACRDLVRRLRFIAGLE